MKCDGLGLKRDRATGLAGAITVRDIKQLVTSFISPLVNRDFLALDFF